MKLKNRVAVVTGGGSGIGEEICRTFAAEGALVAVTDIDREAAERVASEICEGARESIAWSMNVLNSKQVEEVADDVERRIGPIDIWVNNAGVSRIMPFLECTEEVWDLIINVNLKGTFFGCRAAISRMLPRKYGVVLNMSSQSGKQGSTHYQAYCASKFAVVGLTQSLSAEFAREGIRINALCPGVIFTPLWMAQIEDYARKRKIKPADVRSYLEDNIPLGRLCEAREVAKTAVFLASDDASYITGQSINVSGGWIMH